MTAVISRDTTARAHLRLGPGGAFWLMVLAATALSLLMAAPLIGLVWHGGFGDPDDAMRLVEVRAWLAGQSWFDVTALRLDPPGGASMHWSRLVDVPNALLIRLFGLFVGPAQAEALDRIVLPTLLLVGLYSGMLPLATVLLGKTARLPALIGTFLCGVTLVQFQPGRIGHHAPETVALVFAVATLLESFERTRSRNAALAGALVALSVAMSLETLPLLVTLCATLALTWVVRGNAMARPLMWFAAGLGLTLPSLFATTVAPTHWLDPVCDAMGLAHVAVGMVGAAGVLGLAMSSARLRTWPVRLAAVALVGAAVVLVLSLCFPACLRSPFSGVDPLVRAVWLDNVVESKPLWVFMRDRPMTGLAICLPVVLGLVGALAAALKLEGLAASRFAVIAALTAVGLAAGLWQVRVFASVAPLALCGGLFFVGGLRERLTRSGLTLAAGLAPAAILPFTSTAWALALPPGPMPHSSAGCLAPTALAPLAALASGRIVAPLDVGSHLLVATPHDVFAAPYHRNNDGNLFALGVFLAAPERAQAMLAARDVAYVVTCDGMGETHRLALRAPGGLAADLEAGRVPAFLSQLPLGPTPFRVYAFHKAPE